MPHPPGTIGVICYDSLRYTSFVPDLFAMRAPDGSRIVWAVGLQVSTNANHIVSTMLANPEHQWVMFMGDDHLIKRAMLERLLTALDNHPEYDAIAPLVLRRVAPWQSVGYANDPRVDPTPIAIGQATGVIEVAAVGNAGLVVRRRVFEAMSEPYFRVGQMNPANYQEDLEFCERARKHGFRFAIDLDTPMGHLTTFALWPARDPEGNHVLAIVDRSGVVVPVDLHMSTVTSELSPVEDPYHA